jgi:hypothetical protein
MADVFRFPAPPPKPTPKNTHRVTFFHMVGPSGRPLTCAALDVETGVELRLSYDEEVMRSELFRGVDCDERLAEAADIWRRLFLEKGFSEVSL